MPRKTILAAFPRLQKTHFLITSQHDPGYNCIGWAAGDTHNFWWPLHHPHAYWPPGLERREALECFLEAFATLGYQPCDNGSLEAGFEKVALFVDSNGVPKHAARQLPSGSWTSKLGEHEDISHSIYGLEGSTYGTVAKYLRRPRKAA